MAKKVQKRNLFGLFKKKETYRSRIVRTGGMATSGVPKKAKSIRYLGARIILLKSGEYTTSLERESRFDDVAGAKAFVKFAKGIKGNSKHRNAEKKAKNPAKFNHCVSKVKKSLKKAKRPGNAYAICSAAGTRNPQSSKELRAKGWRLVDAYKTRATAEAVTKQYSPFRLVSRSGKWEVWTRQQLTKNCPRPTFARKNPVWSAKQGGAEARVYKTPTTAKDYVIELLGPRGHEEFRASTFGGAKAIARLRLHEFAGNPDPSIVPGADYATTLVKAGHRVVKGVAKAGKQLLKKAKKIGRKKNPIEVAVKRYEEFHGYPVNETTIVESKAHRHSVTYGIGQLICMNVVDVDGKQLPPLIAPGFKYVDGPLKDIYLQFNGGGNPLTPEQANAKGFWDFQSKDPAKIVWLTAGEDNKQLLIDGGDQSLDLKALGFIARDYHDHMLIGTIVRVWYRTRKKFEGDEEVDFFHDFGREGSHGVLPVLNYRPKDPSLEIAGGRYEIALPDKGLGGVSPGIVG
jgi:hypothetical protein